MKTRNNDKEISKYEVGLRAFAEIGFRNVTKFVATVCAVCTCEE